MNPFLGFMIESLVAVLLVLTIAYCMILNKRLQRLKADEHSLKAVIAELVTATEIAERAIGGLKLTVRDVNENLGAQLVSAREMSGNLNKQLAEADHVVRRLSKIAFAARSPLALEPEAPPAPVAAPLAPAAVPAPAAAVPARMSSAKAVAAAAQAFTERKRVGGLAA